MLGGCLLSQRGHAACLRDPGFLLPVRFGFSIPAVLCTSIICAVFGYAYATRYAKSTGIAIGHVFGR
jgi:hypothetical protein